MLFVKGDIVQLNDKGKEAFPIFINKTFIIVNVVPEVKRYWGTQCFMIDTKHFCMTTEFNIDNICFNDYPTSNINDYYLEKVKATNE